MYDLFNPIPDNIQAGEKFQASRIVNDTSKVSGLLYVPNFISDADERLLVETINAQSWLSDIKRRVQHYGYKYDYKARSIDYSMFLGTLPLWAQKISRRLYNEKFIDQEPDQVIVNEYLPGQGIANHVDCEPCFGETVISISLGSTCIMDFIDLGSKEKIEVLLEPRSLVIINGPARHSWTHGIAQRKTDVFKGTTYARKVRISMTFRKVVLIK
jgi:alkylated DNA repair dioxygenase AlkB